MTGKRQDPVYQAMNILARRDHAQAEVILKLKRKGFTEQEIAKAIEYLQEKRLLDDARFAKSYIESILQGKAVGPRYLRAKLKQKGVGEGIIREAIEKVFRNPPQPSFIKEGENPPLDKGEQEGISENRELILVQQAVLQWKRLHPKHAGDKQRLYRFLLSRGFTSDAIAGSVLPPEGE